MIDLNPLTKAINKADSAHFRAALVEIIEEGGGKLCTVQFMPYYKTVTKEEFVKILSNILEVMPDFITSCEDELAKLHAKVIK